MAFILISLWISDELTFNRIFSKADNIYQLSAKFDDQNDKFTYTSPPAISTFAAAGIPAIDQGCKVLKSMRISFRNEQVAYDESGLYADPSFFNIFDLPAKFIHENQPFSTPRSIVISKQLAQKYFGSQNPLGQTSELELDWIIKTKKEPFVVSGIIDNFPENSSLKGDFILPMELLKSIKGNDFENQWGEFQYSVYFLLHHQANPQEVAKQLTKIQKNKFNTEETSDQNSGLYAQFRYYLQPLNQVNLYRPDGQGNGIQVVYTLMSIGFIILLIACVNYVNLMTAKTTKRSKEISLRKIVGAKKMQLIFQYLTESSIIFSIALFLAIMMAYFCIPFFNEIAGKDLAFDFLSRDLYYILSITFLTTIILAGIYPAIIFSKKRVIGVTNGGVSAGTPQNHVRKLLVVIQFSCTIILIVSTIVFGKQFDFMRNKDLGYDQENVFLFEQKNFLGHYDAIRDELEKQAGILGVTAASSDLSNFGSETADIDWQGKSSEQQNFFITQVGIDRNFLQVMDIELSAGHGFLGTPADSNYV
ncbi:MAG: ABC transporter permease, partial [Sphingobacterium sp.]